ncbi:MAG: hypothetical protein ACOY8P_05055 [Thermodesulfobacteriota bacterium]
MTAEIKLMALLDALKARLEEEVVKRDQEIEALRRELAAKGIDRP